MYSSEPLFLHLFLYIYAEPRLKWHVQYDNLHEDNTAAVAAPSLSSPNWKKKCAAISPWGMSSVCPSPPTSLFSMYCLSIYSTSQVIDYIAITIHILLAIIEK